jgi:type II secretory pathway component PulC
MQRIVQKLALLSAISLIGVAHASPRSNLVIKSDGEDIGLSIIGSIANSASGNNVALVKEKESGRVLALKSGSKIGERYTVVEVRPKYIALSSNGEYRIVYQDKFAGEFSKSAAANLKGQLAAYKEDGFERQEGNIRVTAQYRDRLVKEDLSAVLMQATAVPYQIEGKVIGFQLLQIDKDSIYDKSGFRDTDIITTINGQDLNSVSGAVNLLNSLRKESQIEIDYLRGGVKQKVQMKID